MPAFYPLISLISMALFAWVGRAMAIKRRRNRTGWMLAGALFPPLLLILLMMGPANTEPDDDASDADET
ncbi:MAG: hypothetical protein KDE14_14680 [Rhodobacteraceae bacterium]|nr:hypothetical protein [Paracoccaceae bacterium]